MANVKIQGNASGSGVLTITAPNTDATRTITLPDSTGTLLVATERGRVFLSNTVISDDATVSITANIDSTYDVYEIELVNIVNATDAQTLQFLLSTDGGSSYLSSYQFSARGAICGATSDTHGGADGGSVNTLTPITVGTATGEGLCGSMKLYAPASTGINTYYKWELSYEQSGGFITSATGAGDSNVTTAINAIRWKTSSGNITSGNIYLYGIRKS